MDIYDINKMWAEDCKFNDTDLGGDALKIPKLHNKYFMMYAEEGLRLKKYRADLKMLQQNKHEWLAGTMAEEDMKLLGWKPNPLKILKADIQRYIETDKDVVDSSLRIDFQLSMVNYLEDIIKQIHSRNFYINNAIAWARFQSGS